MTKFDHDYQKAISALLSNGAWEANQRTGKDVKALPGVSLSINLEEDGFPLLSLRPIPVKTFVAETVFYLTGKKDPTLLQKYTRIWDAFLDKDGMMPTSYGFRWRHAFDRDQIVELIELLKEDPTSRQGVISMWDPRVDGLKGPKVPNIPCPITMTVQIIGGKLHTCVTMRSQDAYLGLPTDVADFALLNMMFAQEFDVTPGTHTHFIANNHLYDNQIENARVIAGRDNVSGPMFFQLPRKSLQRAMEGDTGLIDEITQIISDVYEPSEKLPAVKIAI